MLHRLHSATSSSWAIWVRRRVCLATLKGPLQGEHWDALRSLLPIYRALTVCEVHDGRATAFWFDAWCGQDDLATMFPALLSHCKKPKISVRSMLEQGLTSSLTPRLTEQGQKDLESLQNLLAGVELTEQPDTRRCLGAGDDERIKSGRLYQVLRASHSEINKMDAYVWRSKAPPRVQFFGWLISQKRLQCRTNLAKKNIVEDGVCVLCKNALETATHLLLECDFASLFWRSVGVVIKPSDSAECLQAIDPPAQMPKAEFNTFILLCCWQIWKRRNNIIFRGEVASLQNLVFCSICITVTR